MMKPPASADLPSPAIKKTVFDLDVQDIDQGFTEFPIDTMVEFIENTGEDHKDTPLHSPKVSMATIHKSTEVDPKVMITTSQEGKKKSKNKIITPAQFYRLQE